MEFNIEIKKLFDVSVDQNIDVQANCVEESINRVYDYICNGYPQSRESVQYAIAQLERVPRIAMVKMLLMVMGAIHNIADKFLREQSPSLSFFDTHISVQLFDRLLDKISIDRSGEQNITQLNLEIAQKLTPEERKKMVGYCVQSAETLALKTNWNDGIINFYTMMQVIMYSICEKDDIMDLFFNWNNNILDRFVTSGQYQHARDFAESLLIIGHQQEMIAEAYFDASRAYAGGGNALAGLLYLNITLLDLNKRKSVRRELAFDIIWQTMKIMRIMHFYNQSFIDELLQIYETLHMDDYNTLSVYHTAFTVGIAANPNATANRVESFLNEKREIIFNNMDHSAIPWYTLFRSIQLCGETGDYPMMRYMENMMKMVLIKNGNKNLVDLCEGEENQTRLLLEELVKLESTRNSKDYSYASGKALLLAKNVLDNAVIAENAEEFILAMRPLSDFSFAMPESNLSDMFKRVDITDPSGKNYRIAYGETNTLALLLQTEKSDCVMWIGHGNSDVWGMTLVGNMYKFDKLLALKAMNVKDLQTYVLGLKFNRVGVDSREEKYDKDVTELEKEANDIYQRMQVCSLPISNVTNRIFFIKDLDLSPVPHQLIVDERTNKFVGELYPSANAISTEFLIKSNFNHPLSKGFSKAYWSPLNKETMFAIIKDSLSQIFEKYHIIVDGDDEPSEPLHADLNIVCAHGADNISETEWFYADHAPIVNSYKVVGHGKVLVLFTCYSGSITYQHYDNAMHSIVKKYLRMGYSSVIAPMWSLNIEILPTWLDVFLQIMETGGYVVDAVYQANMKVKEHFISPAAWACLHLFGNPYMQIADKPVLSVTEEQVPSNIYK